MALEIYNTFTFTDEEKDKYDSTRTPIYSKELILEANHKPLISIARRNLSDCPPRIQGLLLKLQDYTFELIFTPGKPLAWADLLSRASNPNRESSTEVDVKLHVDMIVNSLPVSEQK